VRVCVVGCGAVGSLFAANLSLLDDVEVWAYDLAREHVDAINASGLRLSGAGEVLGRPRATADADELPPCDFGIVATKAMYTGAAVAATAHAFAEGCVASVQNGVGNEEAIAEHVERVIRGTTFPAGKLLEPGHVQWDVKGDTTFGPFEPRPSAPEEAIAALADACTRAGMPTTAVADARPAQWRKVIFNAATNPVGALTGLTHGRVCERPDLRALVTGLVDEGKAVAAAQGIALDADPEELIDHAAKPDVAYGHKASMLQDVEARRATEVDYLNGGIARFGREHGVPTPLHDTITALVKGIEASWTQS
jgi:2-dehydropantoate 2-reductase